MKNQKGITLVSLIITIIVMVILAGIALIFSVGEEGVIFRAEEVKKNQKYVNAKEKISTGYEYTNEGKVDLEKTKNNIDALGLDEIRECEIEENILKIVLENDEEIEIPGYIKNPDGPKEPVRGDLNFDGVLNDADVTIMQELINRNAEVDDTDPELFKAADLNPDEFYIDLVDLVILNAIISGDINKTEKIRGDLNFDGVLNEDDVTIMELLVNTFAMEGYMDPELFKVSDLSPDGYIDVMDLTILNSLIYEANQ